jgi:hypothetical protein
MSTTNRTDTAGFASSRIFAELAKRHGLPLPFGNSNIRDKLTESVRGDLRVRNFIGWMSRAGAPSRCGTFTTLRPSEVSLKKTAFLKELAALRGYELRSYDPVTQEVSLKIHLALDVLRFEGYNLREQDAVKRAVMDWVPPFSCRPYAVDGDESLDEGEIGAMVLTRGVSFLFGRADDTPASQSAGCHQRSTVRDTVSRALAVRLNETGVIDDVSREMRREEAVRIAMHFLAIATREDWHDRKHAVGLWKAVLAVGMAEADGVGGDVLEAAEKAGNNLADFIREIRAALKALKLFLATFSNVAPMAEIPDCRGAQAQVSWFESRLLKLEAALQDLRLLDEEAIVGLLHEGLEGVFERSGLMTGLRGVICFLAVGLQESKNPGEHDRVRDLVAQGESALLEALGPRGGCPFLTAVVNTLSGLMSVFPIFDPGPQLVKADPLPEMDQKVGEWEHGAGVIFLRHPGEPPWGRFRLGEVAPWLFLACCVISNKPNTQEEK